MNEMNVKERKDIGRLTRILVSYAHKRDIPKNTIDAIYETAWGEVEKVNQDVLWKQRYDKLIKNEKITVICPTDNEKIKQIPDNARRIGQVFICPIHGTPYTIIINETNEKITIDDRNYTIKLDNIDPNESKVFWNSL